MTDFTIHFAKDADIAPIMELENACFSPPWSEGAILREIYGGGSVFLLAREEAALAGFCVAWTVGSVAELLQIAVSRDHRRRGAASAMLSRILDELRGRGVDTLFLEVRESNAAAFALYEKFGFERAGLRRGYYESPREDAATMRLMINGGAV